MMKNGRPQKIYSEEEKTAIKKAYKKSRNVKERARLLCAKLRIVKQMTSVQIAIITELSKGYVDSIISLYTRLGLEAIAPKKQVGNHRNMTFEQETEFLEKFRKRAIAGEMLEISEIIKAYCEKVGKQISKSTVYDMLHRHDWRKVMPRKEHPKKASAEEIEEFKKKSLVMWITCSKNAPEVEKFFV